MSAGVPPSGSGHSPKGGAASASPAKPSVPNAAKKTPDDCLAVSSSANFYPELDNPDEFDGSTIIWSFELPKSQPVGAGVYRLQFVRTLAEEKALGNPVLEDIGQ